MSFCRAISFDDAVKSRKIAVFFGGKILSLLRPIAQALTKGEAFYGHDEAWPSEKPL